ncbi:ABC transporter ATP-binding protein [Leptospira levettii]|uniref:ABC transporter ATP-binding protein n=3 Tax=Leptospira levettii TaxID=2023178 RepID=A0A2N0AXV9_9LEPT|nr:ABC transporter ATP-binding protein [Leptospira levettii]PKA27341.1 ABC transporter ATP-binding protein [Leptospira sp. mixed culture ATI2-C-A1]MCG6148704.1 ABC transporter ATP-binding protein [Leptospira levettii]MCW7467618.1 ABC transporter ATP-binding protein [Leptospira levettii]MCW7472592.1 ABC transporter ATP-binding protein [Leptospira levettii]MCW7498406.1 ABC transporter ATP-binding protein [Leptospira levettii]
MLLRVHNLTKRFGNEEAVSSVSFDVNQGDYVAIIGPSGSGKTTLLSMLTGMLSPTEGDILYDQIKLSQISKQELAEIRARDLGLVFQFSELVGNLTIKENILLPALFTKKFSNDDYIRKCDYLIDHLKLGDIQNSLPRTLSGGQIQKAAIARSLINDPAILFADEPSGDLDPENSYLVQLLLNEYNKRNHSIILVTHDMKLAFDAQTVYEMKNGRFEQVIKGE